MAKEISSYVASGNRVIELARTGDPDLGPLKLLPGTWANFSPDRPDLPNLSGRGWNMIALPFATNGIDYRLLLNQYNENLKISLVDKKVPNRGIDRSSGQTFNTDQEVVTLDYEQVIAHISTTDNPASTITQPIGAGIHHEPGLFLYMLNQVEDGIDIARLGTIPHGDSLLALGKSQPSFQGSPVIAPINGLPIGVNQNLSNPYLSPYDFFDKTPFMGTVPPGTGFPGFNPVHPHLLLVGAIPGNAIETTILKFDTTTATGGINNIPFIVKQANATELLSTFWISELKEKDRNGNSILVLQYAQIVHLEFFPRKDGKPGLIKWPHVSINTLVKVEEPTAKVAAMPSTSSK